MAKNNRAKNNRKKTKWIKKRQDTKWIDIEHGVGVLEAKLEYDLDDRYRKYGDDSSDEELEAAICKMPLRVPDKGDESLLLNIKYKSASADDTESIDKFIDEIKSNKEILTARRKYISAGKKIKPKVEELLIHLASRNDRYAKYAEIAKDAYVKSKVRDPKDIKNRIIKSVKQEGNLCLNLGDAAVLANLGRRLLISTEVGKTYFPLKETLGNYTELPRKDEIISLLKERTNTFLDGYKLKNERLKSGLASWINENYGRLFLLHIPRYEIKLVKEITNIFQKNSYEILESVWRRRITGQIEKVVNDLNDGFVTKKSKISISKHMKNAVLNDLVVTERSPIWLKAFCSTYKELKKTLKQENFIKDCITKCCEIYTETSFAMNYTGVLHDAMNELSSKILRPTLQDASIKFYDDMCENFQGAKSILLFSYIRLMHCSQKRYIKNVHNKDDFEGAFFSRAWCFNKQKPVYIIETQQLTKKEGELTVSSYVRYGHKSDYKTLCDKILRLQSDYNIDDRTIVECIKSVLSVGILPKQYAFNDGARKLLLYFTYHLFVTEIQRHPAAAIHNVMALDIIFNKNKDFESTILSLPMSVDKALPVVRGVQEALYKELELPYRYNKSDKQNTRAPEDREFYDYVTKEKKLIMVWAQSRGINAEMKQHDEDAVDYTTELHITDPMLSSINGLCEDYYGIQVEVVGEI